MLLPSRQNSAEVEKRKMKRINICRGRGLEWRDNTDSDFMQRTEMICLPWWMCMMGLLSTWADLFLRSSVAEADWSAAPSPPSLRRQPELSLPQTETPRTPRETRPDSRADARSFGETQHPSLYFVWTDKCPQRIKSKKFAKSKWRLGGCVAPGYRCPISTEQPFFQHTAQPRSECLS